MFSHLPSLSPTTKQKIMSGEVTSTPPSSSPSRSIPTPTSTAPSSPSPSSSSSSSMSSVSEWLETLQKPGVSDSDLVLTLKKCSSAVEQVFIFFYQVNQFFSPFHPPNFFPFLSFLPSAKMPPLPSLSPLTNSSRPSMIFLLIIFLKDNLHHQNIW